MSTFNPNANMNFADKVLYHQIHPLKLGTDILASLVSLYFFWQHKLVTGLILHLAPPLIASLVVLYAFDLEPQRQSALGQYVKRTMAHGIEAIRLMGDIVMVLGAWFHSVPLIGAGLAILWQIAPWRTGSQHPEDAVQHAAVIHTRHATGFVGEKRFDHAPFGVSQVVSDHASHESDFAVT
jgi:hypothetical protein